MEWFENDDLFFKELDQSVPFTRSVGERLMAEGFRVQIPEISKRRSVEERYAYADEVDLRVLLTPRAVPLEVKSRRLAFTGPDDYPFATAFVDTVSGWNAKQAKPPFVILVSRKTPGGLVAVATENWEHDWVARRSGDGVRGFSDMRYEVARELLLPWSAVVEWLRREERRQRSAG